YHKIKGKYLQLYLDEFCYKLNRRYFGNRLFERLTLAVAKSYW
ncbi:MAG: IS1595 family transposase, partial [Flavobacteriales bacterium]|nr:IS1595 family transposase [Flavobacteriales bacterium]